MISNKFESFSNQNCVDCHDGDDAEAGLDLGAIRFDLDQQDVFDHWVLIHDRIRDGEMPPPEDTPEPLAAVGWSTSTEAKTATNLSSDRAALRSIALLLENQDRKRIDQDGRSMVRRLNRFEYENLLRKVLDAPWLQIADQLPEDSIAHLFNKSGERLDVSHVQLSRYLEVTQTAIRLAVNAAAHPDRNRPSTGTL